MSESLKNILSLSIEEKIEAVEAIWNSIANEEPNIPLTPEQENEIRRRIELYRSGKQETMSWEEAEKFIKS